MNLLLHIIQAFFITSINGYMLFAADINDFKLIAQKYMPALFAEKLAHIAAETSLFKANDESNSNNYRPASTYDSDAEKKETKPPQDPEPQADSEPHDEEPVTQTVATTDKDNADKNKNVAISGIDLDTLVEKIKERLDKHYLEKYKNLIIKSANINPQGSNPTEGQLKATTTETIPERDSFQNPKQPEYDYKNKELDTERVPSKEPLRNNEPSPEQNAGVMEFEEKDLTNTKDSYEDYRMPPKYEIKQQFKRPTEKTTNTIPTIKGLGKGVKKHKTFDYEDIQWDDEERYDHDPNEDGQAKTVFKSSEIQAKTEMMNYDDHSYKVTDTSPSYINTKKVSNRLTKGTGIPTRERFSMSSPNYYASIPIVAEKYDFNEPLPEKDREHENMKYILNQPARINKKVSV